MLRTIAAAHGKSVPACAIRYILDAIPDSVVLAGVKRPAQLASNLEAMDWHLSAAEQRELDEVSR